MYIWSHIGTSWNSPQTIWMVRGGQKVQWGTWVVFVRHGVIRKVMCHVKARGDDPCRYPWTGLALPNCSKVSWLQCCQDRSFEARCLSPMFCITRHQSTKSESRFVSGMSGCCRNWGHLRTIPGTPIPRNIKKSSNTNIIQHHLAGPARPKSLSPKSPSPDTAKSE